jgi:hypothetical protein
MARKYKKGVRHHPDYDYPHWTINLKNNMFHKVLTVIQNMKATPENLADIRAFCDSLEYEYLQKRRVLDEYDILLDEKRFENTELD